MGIRWIAERLDGRREWHPMTTAPFNRDVEARVAEERGSRVVPFPCRQTAAGWVNADLGVRVGMEPIAWRPWPANNGIRTMRNT